MMKGTAFKRKGDWGDNLQEIMLEKTGRGGVAKEVTNLNRLHFASYCTETKLIMVHLRQEYLGEEIK